MQHRVARTIALALTVWLGPLTLAAAAGSSAAAASKAAPASKPPPSGTPSAAGSAATSAPPSAASSTAGSPAGTTGTPAGTTAGPTSPEITALLAKVQAAYKQGGGDLTAAFKQVSVEAVRNKKRTESGRLWAKRDGRVRWSYEKPTSKDFVFDGKTAYFYEPENAQVTVFNKFEQSTVWSALRVFWGQGTISDTFQAFACDSGCPAADAGEQLLKLVPKQPMASVERVIVGVDSATGFVRRSIVYDSLGNRTEYYFSDIKLGATIDDAKFAFKIPQGVNMLRGD